VDRDAEKPGFAPQSCLPPDVSVRIDIEKAIGRLVSPANCPSYELHIRPLCAFTRAGKTKTPRAAEGHSGGFTVLEDLGTGQTGHFIVAFAVVGLGLVALFAVMWFIRGRSNSTFIRGGKNRQPRLAVLDAAPVDTRRRLVLVRRDSVEHLILIGGPTDVVIESRIASDTLATADELSPDLHEAPGQPIAAQRPERPEQPARAAGSPTPAPSSDQGREPASPAMAARTASPSPSTVRTPQDAEPVSRKAAEAAPAQVRPTEPARPAAVSQPVTARPINVQSVAAQPSAAQPSAAQPSAAQNFGAHAARPAATLATATVATTPVTQRPETEVALDALDAARDRVLSGVESETARSADGPQAAYYEFEPSSDETRSDTSPQLSPQASQAQTVAAFPATVRPTPSAEQPQRTDAMSDFESILEAELSGDIAMDEDDLVRDGDIAVLGADDSRDGDLSGVSASGTNARTASAGNRDVDTLEDEMDKLLGDLTRRG
jgi:flagellar biosynthesis protein FliO